MNVGVNFYITMKNNKEGLWLTLSVLCICSFEFLRLLLCTVHNSAFILKANISIFFCQAARNHITFAHREPNLPGNLHTPFN